MNEIIESLYQRKSVRAYEDRAIPEEMKKLILKAASQAPTAGCQQLYTILDITDQKLKEARVKIVILAKQVIKDALELLGIQCPEQM